MPKEKGDFYLVNKRARFDYEIEEEFDAGLSLLGPEIKALREHRARIEGAFVKMVGAEPFLVGAYFYLKEGEKNRSIKLLLHKKEVNRLMGKVEKKGYAILPLSIYQKRGLAKLKIGLGRGKKQFEKRALIKEREEGRQLRRIVKEGR